MKAVAKSFAVAVILGLFSISAAVTTTPPAVDDQPHMQAALEHLRKARAELDAAIPDKGGHRAAAIKATNDAIKHTEEGIAYANAHP